jgi:hypothetical protein
MKPHNRLTIVPNRYRARELRNFRDLVEVYFERSQRDPDDVLADWEGTRAARSSLHRMLPRVIEFVRAAGLGGQVWTTPVTDPGLRLGRVDVLQRIFSAHYSEGVEQEVFDVLDMAIGVYDGDLVIALARTFNPLHYAGMVLRFLGRGPRWLFGVLGLRSRTLPPHIGEDDLARLEDAASRITHAEELIDTRFAALQDRQALRHAENAAQIAELAERLDFAERILAQRRPQSRIDAPKDSDITTPV